MTTIDKLVQKPTENQLIDTSHETRLRLDLLDNFLGSTDISPASTTTYKRVLRLYFDYLDKNGLYLHSLNIGSIIGYKQHLHDSGLKDLTICTYLAVLRRFYQWTHRLKILPNITEGVKLPKFDKKPRKLPLTIDQASTIINQETPPRDKALLTLMLRTGLRTCEVIRANIKDIEPRGGRLVLNVQGKGRTEADNFVVIGPRTWETLSAYLVSRGPVDPSSPLFVSHSNRTKNQRLTTRSVRGIVKNNLRAIGLNSSKYSAHSTRHTGATCLLAHTGDLELVKTMLRHTTTASTMRYTMTIQETLRLKNPGESVLETLY